MLKKVKPKKVKIYSHKMCKGVGAKICLRCTRFLDTEPETLVSSVGTTKDGKEYCIHYLTEKS